MSLMQARRIGKSFGSRSILTEGVRVGAGAVLGPNVSLTASVPVIDVTGAMPVEHRGIVPPRATQHGRSRCGNDSRCRETLQQVGLSAAVRKLASCCRHD